MKKAVFLDRDGTINEDVGYLFRKKDLVFIPGSIEALKMLQQDHSLFIITNQPGIGKGVFTLEQYNKFDEYFQSILREEGIYIQNTYFCPHRKDEQCSCYKPGTLSMEKASKNYCIDMKCSYVIGDHPHDVEMGKRMGSRTVYLLSGHGLHHRNELSVRPDHICKDLREAAVQILQNNNDQGGQSE